jgi:YesN/AraC family two-component response regulator
MSISVVIADDQALVRGGFRMILDTKAGLGVLGEAADGREAVELVARLEPDARRSCSSSSAWCSGWC